MGISLYRQYRPQKFSEVAGQSSAVDVLTKSLERGQVGHAYLFSGPRGCGKTTAARLLAKALNCLSPIESEPCCQCKNCLSIAAGESLDVVEIDGASNNGVDEVRELKTHVTLAPFSSKYKVYIIDEVHMLSIAAFNALLKTLEEPPAYVVFILATTEAHKVPVTIRSRCQHIPFHRIGTKEINERLALVCGAEGIASAPDALWEIARQADGALRDALSMLEQIAGLGKSEITLPDVEAALGQVTRSSMERWLSNCRGDIGPEAFTELDRLLSSGASPQRFIEELFSLVRNLWLAARWKDTLGALDASEQEKEYLGREAHLWNPAALESLMRFLAELMPQTRMGLRVDVLGGLLMTKMVNLKDGVISAAPAEAPKSIQSAPQFDRGEPPAPRKAPGRSTASGKGTAPAPENFVSSTVPAAEPAEQLDSSAWKPYPEEQWNAALSAAHEKEFMLYCGLLGVTPFTDGEKGALVLDAEERYCYEVLKLDRHRLALLNILTPDDAAAKDTKNAKIILRCGQLWAPCDAVSAKHAAPQNDGSAPRRSYGKKAAANAAGPGDSYRLPQDAGDERDSARPSDVPFSGLVQEVTRWLGAELIMVRGGEGTEAAIEDTPGEE